MESPEHRRVRQDVRPTLASEDKALDILGDEYEQKLLRRRQDIEAARRLRALRNEDDKRRETAATKPVASAVTLDVLEQMKVDHDAALLAVARLTSSKVADQFALDKLKDGIFEFEEALRARRTVLCQLGSDLRDHQDRLDIVAAKTAAARHEHSRLSEVHAEISATVSTLQSAAARPAAAANDEWERMAGVLREEKRKVLEEKTDIEARLRKLRVEVSTLHDSVQRELSQRPK